MPDSPSLFSPKSRRTAKLVLPIAGLGLLAGGVGLLIQATQRAHTVSTVTREICTNVLRKPNGGPIGPWWISATEQDPLTGEFKNFNLESGAMRISARTARLSVDPHTDTFSFELWNVVMTRVPKTDEDVPDHHLIQLDHHVLGPAPYGIDITPDGG